MTKVKINKKVVEQLKTLFIVSVIMFTVGGYVGVKYANTQNAKVQSAVQSVSQTARLK